MLGTRGEPEGDATVEDLLSDGGGAGISLDEALKNVGGVTASSGPHLDPGKSGAIGKETATKPSQAPAEAKSEARKVDRKDLESPTPKPPPRSSCRI